MKDELPRPFANFLARRGFTQMGRSNPKIEQREIRRFQSRLMKRVRDK